MTDFWPLEPIWSGATVFILGGGPSLAGVDLDRLRGRTVVALNAAAKCAPWASALLFVDQPWLDKNHEIVAGWKQLAFTITPPPMRNLPENVKQVSAIKMDALYEGGSIRRGQSTGHTAVALAAAFGAKRIILLGYDMRRVDDRSHWHDDYSELKDGIYSDVFVPGFAGWNEAAKRHGAEVLNATPGSALKEFPPTGIEDHLSL